MNNEKDLYPLDYYLTIFSRERTVNRFGKTEDGLSKELITAVYSVARDKADMSRMCNVLRKYQVNTLQKLKGVSQTEMAKWRNVGSKTVENFALLQSLPNTEEQETIIRRFDVNKLKHELALLASLAFDAGVQHQDIVFDYDNILNKAMVDKL